jgi:nitronate monooxygenase
MMVEFQIIQGGMGVGVSNWRLARAVATQGQLGVVSGTGLGVLLARRLQDGDPSGDMRRALAAFPNRRIAETVLRQYHREAPRHRKAAAETGNEEAVNGGGRYGLTPMPLIHVSEGLRDLTIVANFVEVYLAKEGHSGPVGINLMEKIQLPTLASLYGAMLAGVDYVLMGAGIPRSIPGALDALAAGKPAELRIDVANAGAGEVYINRLDPADICPEPSRELVRPKFLAIIASATLAMTLARKANGRVDGFVIELPVAGGHNAPPRGQMALNELGEPVYGDRDEPDMKKIRDLGLPFFLAGGYASPAGLARARSMGAQGVQVGTLFAFCEESGIDPELKAKTRAQALAGTASVFTDPLASPTGFPFKVLQMPGTLSEVEVYTNRPRVCDLGYLRQAYRKGDGTIGYRCPAEPVESYVKKGGNIAETRGRKCLCNGLFSTLGLGQVGNEGQVEPPIITSGDDVANLPAMLRGAAVAGSGGNYTAADVLAYLLSA